MMEIRAKARRLTQKAELRLVVIDYMQLMSSGKKYESRQQEVSDFSRKHQADGQGARRSGGRDQPAEPRSRAAHRQAAACCPTYVSRVPDGEYPNPAGRHWRRGDLRRADAHR